MMTAKVSLLLVLSYVLALAAGTTSGFLADRLGAWATPAPTDATAPLAAQLSLTADQCKQIRGVWEGVSETLDGCYGQAQKIQQQRDEALFSLLTSDQKAQFAIMDREYARQFASVVQKRQAAFEDGLSRTEVMLSDSQRAKYEQIVHNRLGDAVPIGDSATQPSLQAVQP